MAFYIGLDIGGTKIAGGAFDEQGSDLGQHVTPTPQNYPDFVKACAAMIAEMDARVSAVAGADDIAHVGIGVPFAVANMPYLAGKEFASDMSALIKRPVRVGNDANCAALAEAIEGAGKGFDTVFGLIIGTGVGGGYVSHGRVVSGANGLMGEIGHIPLPYYEDADGDRVQCGCGQKGCIEKLVCGAALSRLHKKMTGREATAVEISAAARAKEPEALHVLDCYFTVVAKAMVGIIHTFDPDVITVSGGLNSLPGLYEAVTKRWGQYTVVKDVKTKLVPARYGSLSGLRGASLLWKA